MTDYTNHADALFQTGAPILGSVALETRDNLLSVAEGQDIAAPKIQLLAFQRLVAGGAIRSTATYSMPISGVAVKMSSFGIMQSGGLRVRLSEVSGDGGSVQIRRVRAGASATLATVDSDGGSADITVKHGDVVETWLTNTTASTIRVELCTAGGDLWVGSGGNVVNNDV